ncbi:MAG: tyrosine-type recombinase/integrase [Hyphomicrobium sp.]|uniref:tyrosine-type recombinase/integrase n=1 Tax=Hyphomicrobium sp. TaxID=82 RepID=UPI0039E5DCA6
MLVILQFPSNADDEIVTSQQLRLSTSFSAHHSRLDFRICAVLTSQAQHVQSIVARRAETPGAANDLLKKLRILLHFAIDNGWRKDDPTIRIKKFAGGEFHTWTDDEIAVYEKRWAVGTRERTAFGLLLFTGQRASDVAKMMWSEIGAAGIWVVQRKTKAKLLVPIHPQLREILSACEIGTGAILQTSFGAPFTAKGFSNFMAERISQAGLAERCVTHGLRKAAARRLAEAGCSANEIASVTGHATLEEVARYTKAAEQKKLAHAAMNRLTNSSTGKFPNLREGLGNSEKDTNEIRMIVRRWRSLRESNPSFQIENRFIQ